MNGLKAHQKIKAVVAEAIGMVTHQEAQEDMLLLITALTPLLHAQVEQNTSWINGIKAHQKIKAVVTEATGILGVVTHQEAQVEIV